MADYVVVYNSTSGFVYDVFERATSDNTSTFKADGKLTVDGEDVMILSDDVGSDIEADVVTVASLDTEAGPGVYEVDSLTAPTTATEREDGGREGGVHYEFTV